MQVGDRVTKTRGVRRGEGGVVVATDGLRVKVAADSGGAFIWQLQRNFVVVATNAPCTPPSMAAPLPVMTPTEQQISEAPTPGEEPVEGPRVQFAEPRGLVVCFWNTLKLGCLKNRRRVVGTCVGRLARKFEVDVLLLSEVPLNVGAERVAQLQAMLETARGVAYTAHFSDASGVGPQQNQREHHVALVRAGLEVDAVFTHHTYVDSALQERPLDHAPFTIFVRDPRFTDKACTRFALTSVHMPPKNRKKDLVVQAKGFLDAYQAQRGWPESLRMHRPFAFSGPSRDFCTHAIGGDFNCDPGLQLDLAHSVWRLGLEGAASSAGRQAYDNALINRGCAKAWMDTSTRLAGFPLCKHGKGGPSDHDAVVLTLTEHAQHSVGV